MSARAPMSAPCDVEDVLAGRDECERDLPSDDCGGPASAPERGACDTCASRAAVSVLAARSVFIGRDHEGERR